MQNIKSSRGRGNADRSSASQQTSILQSSDARMPRSTADLLQQRRQAGSTGPGHEPGGGQSHAAKSSTLSLSPTSRQKKLGKKSKGDSVEHGAFSLRRSSQYSEEHIDGMRRIRQQLQRRKTIKLAELAAHGKHEEKATLPTSIGEIIE